MKTSRSFRFTTGLPIAATRWTVLPNLHRFLNPRQPKADLGFQGWQMEAEQQIDGLISSFNDCGKNE